MSYVRSPQGRLRHPKADGRWAEPTYRLIAPEGSYVDLAAAGLPDFAADAAFASSAHFQNEDLPGTLKTILDRLDPNGILFFEAPACVGATDNLAPVATGWLVSETGLRSLIERTLGCHLLAHRVDTAEGCEFILGVAIRSVTRFLAVRPLLERVIDPAGIAASKGETLARIQLHLHRLGMPSNGDLNMIDSLEQHELSCGLAREVVQLWARDRLYIKQLKIDHQAQSSRLELAERQFTASQAALEALASDAALNATELSREIIRLRSSCEQLASPTASPLTEGGSKASDVTTSRSSELPELRLLDVTGHRPDPLFSDASSWPDTRPLVSIIITSFNYARFVDEAVASALAQTFRSIEVIVVEGGSTAGESRLHIAELDRCKVRVVMQGNGHRAGANRNFGISQARGKYICCLDADDVLRPTYIEKAAFLIDCGSFDVVSSAIEFFGRESMVHQLVERPILGDLVQENNILTCAVFRRSLWELAGGYRDVDKSVTGYVYEDWAFWVRLGALGARFYNMSQDPLFRYRVHGISLSRGTDVLTMDQQAQLITAINSDVLGPDVIERSRRQAARLDFSPIEVGSARSAVAVPFSRDGGRRTILLAMPFLTLGGAERLLSSIVGDLVAHGWRVIVVTSLPAASTNGDATAWFEEHTPEIYHLPLFLPRELWERFLVNQINVKGVDLVWIAGSAFAYDNVRALRDQFVRLRVVDLLFNVVGHTENNRRRRDHIDLTIVESDEVRDWLLQHGEVGSRIRLVESGVDLEALKPALRSETFRQAHTNASDDLIVAFCGRWAVEKAPLDFVEMARRIPAGAGARFVMTGAGPLAAEIERAIAEACFEPGVFCLLGEVADVTEVLASSDILVIPSILDGRPVVAMEALACGTPVVASSVGGLPALIHHGVNGWLCEAGRIVDFVDKIVHAASDRPGLARMRLAARASAERTLDANRMFRAYRQALDDVVANEQAASHAHISPGASSGL